MGSILSSKRLILIRMTGSQPVFPFRSNFISPRNFGCCLTLLLCLTSVLAYYTRNRCYGSGDCILQASNQGGGFNDEYHRWLLECGDGEAMTGIYDTIEFMGITQVWCHFAFPLKPPSQGIYPYYSVCNTRNLSMHEYYCYDKKFPTDTINTFTTALYGPDSIDPLTPILMKCCKTPSIYRLDYNRCQWKYTHDKNGEHYDNVWLVRCDTNSVMTGLGMAINPWNSQLHYVWIQCCPVITGGSSIQPYSKNTMLSQRDLDCVNASECAGTAPNRKVHHIVPRSIDISQPRLRTKIKMPLLQTSHRSQLWKQLFESRAI